MTTKTTYAPSKITMTSFSSGIQSVTVDGVDQKISTLPLRESNGKYEGYHRYTLNLYLEVGKTHTVIITDAAGEEHSYSLEVTA